MCCLMGKRWKDVSLNNFYNNNKNNNNNNNLKINCLVSLLTTRL